MATICIQSVISCADVGGWPPLWAILGGPIILSISAVAAVVVALITVRTFLTRKKLDTIQKILSDEQNLEFRKLSSAFTQAKRNGFPDSLKNPKNNEEFQHRSEILSYLNHYEIISIGINEKLLSGDIYKKWIRSDVVGDWNAAKEYIKHLRKELGKPSLYENFERIANDYSR